MAIVKTTVTRRAQTAIPASIRKRHNIRPGDTLAWIDNGETIKVVRLPKDPIRALRGSGKGERLVERLLALREKERRREQG